MEGELRVRSGKKNAHMRNRALVSAGARGGRKGQENKVRLRGIEPNGHNLG